MFRILVFLDFPSFEDSLQAIGHKMHYFFNFCLCIRVTFHCIRPFEPNFMCPDPFLQILPQIFNSVGIRRLCWSVKSVVKDWFPFDLFLCFFDFLAIFVVIYHTKELPHKIKRILGKWQQGCFDSWYKFHLQIRCSVAVYFNKFQNYFNIANTFLLFWNIALYFKGTYILAIDTYNVYCKLYIYYLKIFQNKKY